MKCGNKKSPNYQQECPYPSPFDCIVAKIETKYLACKFWRGDA